MTSETVKYLAKAERCLANAATCLSVNLTNDAGRGAYLAAFHAAQALIFERTGKAAKTHNGVHTQFDRLVMSEPELEKLPTFLHQAYNLKAVADYETEPGSDISSERAIRAVDEARVFVATVRKTLDASST